MQVQLHWRIEDMTYLDWGVAPAFGVLGGFRVRNEAGDDVTAEARASFKDGPEAFDMLFMTAELDLQRSVLAGPTPEEEPDLRIRISLAETTSRIRPRRP